VWLPQLQPSLTLTSRRRSRFCPEPRRRHGPRKRKTLEAQISSFFQKEPENEIQRIVNVFFEQNLITETDNALTYNF